MNPPAIAEIIPNDRATALLEFMGRVILHVRNWGNEMTDEQRYWMMDAIHNIPMYLGSGQEHYWETTLWTIQEYDRRFSGSGPGVSLLADLKASMQRAATGCSLVRH